MSAKTQPKGKRSTKPKAAAAPPAKPAPTFINRAAFLQAWVEGLAIVTQLYDCIAAVNQVFREEPNHPDTFHFCTDALHRVTLGLEQVMNGMQDGPLLSSDYFSDPLSRESPE